MFFDPFGDFGEMLVLLPNVIFLAEIDKVDDRLGSKKEERIYRFDLVEDSNQRYLQ